ncbi:MAG: hypothetical protein ACLFO1_06455 [Spirochaetaceae bacterium]
MAAGEWKFRHKPAGRIDTHARRMESGNFGKSKSVGGVRVLRIDFDPGDRESYGIDV